MSGKRNKEQMMQRAIELREQGMKVPEIAKKLGYNANTLYWYFYDSKKRGVEFQEPPTEELVKEVHCMAEWVLTERKRKRYGIK